MIFYNKLKIEEHSQLYKNRLYNILFYITYRPMPDGIMKRDWLKYQTIDWSGDSYLLNPEGFLEDFHNYNSLEVFQYVLVSARRKYANYKLFRDKTLDTKLVNVEVLKNNRLITIEDGKIKFKYEEQKKWH